MLTLTLLFLAGVLQDALITAYTRAVAVRARATAALIAAATTIASYLLFRHTLFANDGTARLLAIAAGNAFGTWGLLVLDGRGTALRRVLHRARARLRRALRPAPVSDVVTLAPRAHHARPAAVCPHAAPAAFQVTDAPTRTLGRAASHGPSAAGRWTATWPDSAIRVQPRPRTTKPPSAATPTAA